MFNKQIYTDRRNKLKALMGSGKVILPGNNDSPMNYKSNIYPFRQDSTFLYYVGIDKPGLLLFIDIDKNQEILVGDDYSVEDMVWIGPQKSLKERVSESGIEQVLSWKEFKAKKHTIDETHYLPVYRAETGNMLAAVAGISVGNIGKKHSDKLIRAVVDMRSTKEEIEIEEMEKTMAVAAQMHHTAMRMAQEGFYESEIMAAVKAISYGHGGLTSFPPIITINGQTLHNLEYKNQLKNGRLLLCDAGTESPLHYATDHTRTIPVGGVFSERQLAVYNTVLKALNSSIDATKPGVKYKDIHLGAAKIITEGLQDLGLMKGNVDESVKAGAHALFFPHGLGHMIGLDVHDMEGLGEDFVGYDDEVQRSSQFGLAALRLGKKLQKGFTITVEPGIYFIPELFNQWKSESRHSTFINYKEAEKYLDFGGVRLEDDVLVTASGSRIMGDRIAVEPEVVCNLVKKTK